ncbi:UNVERIFIED_CONTAM: hypothetical protein RMT77_011530 [Armadillidium vulgare]
MDDWLNLDFRSILQKMGDFMMYVFEPLLIPFDSSLAAFSNKRKLEEVEKENGFNFDSLLNAPKRRKLMSTSQYIYKTLFEEGKESDVTVSALGKLWHLHKVYLCQSPYFQSMFSGNWRETNESFIHIEIVDENISMESLHLALGSFYLDELNFEPSHVIPLLATAILLQMDPVVDQCTAVMIETINIQTVLKYQEAAKRYGVICVEKACRTWLLHNLMTQVIECTATLRQIQSDLMYELISSPQLYVMQTEFSIYVMLKGWVFLILNPTFKGNQEEAFSEANKFFKNRKNKGWFLEEEGKEFVKVFSSLRLMYLIYHYLDVEMIHADRILPPSWLQPAATQQWYNMLRIDQSKDKGRDETFIRAMKKFFCDSLNFKKSFVIKKANDVPEEEFNKLCTRSGRVVNTFTQLSWRWTGYNFGLDLIMTHDNGVFKLKRNNRVENFANINNHPKRQIMYRLTVASLNDQRQVVYSKSTGIHSVSLSKNEEIRLMTIDIEVKYPLILSANFLIVTPVIYPLLDPLRNTSGEEYIGSDEGEDEGEGEGPYAEEPESL